MISGVNRLMDWILYKSVFYLTTTVCRFLPLSHGPCGWLDERTLLNVKWHASLNIDPLMRDLPLNFQRDFLLVSAVDGLLLRFVFRLIVFSGYQHLWMIGSTEMCQHFCVNSTDVIMSSS